MHLLVAGLPGMPNAFPTYFFGVTATVLGDLDEDGVDNMAVGAYGDDDGGSIRGAVWILMDQLEEGWSA